MTSDQGESAASVFEETDRSPIQRLQYFLHTNQAAAALLVLAISIAVFGVLAGDKLFSPYALSLIMQQVAFTAIVGIGQSLVILTAGIDLSVGAIVGLSSVVMSQFAFQYGVPVPLAILSGFGCGALCGMINGALVALAKVPAFMITLGTWLVFGALPHLYSGGEAVRGQDIEMQAPLLLIFGNSIHVGGATITLGVAAMIVLVMLFWYILNFTAWGRHVYAVGDDPEAAQLSGVRVTRVLISVYMLCGLICCFAGWVLVGRVHAMGPGLGSDAHFESITAAIIGGISLFGGRGSVLGMFAGALTMGVLSLGLHLVVPDAQWTYLAIGVFIVGAAALDQWIRRVAV